MGIVRGKTAHKTKDLTVIITVRPGGEAIVTHEEKFVDKLLSRYYDKGGVRRGVSDNMYIEGRKKKTESMNRLTEMRKSHEHYVKCVDNSTKAVREMTMYLLLRMGNGYVAHSYWVYFGISERTMYRPIRELEEAGVTPSIIHIGNDIMIGERFADEDDDEWIEYGMGNLEAPRSSKAHILRMHRIFQIFEAFEDEYLAAFWNGEEGELRKRRKLIFSFGPADILKRMPELDVDLRTVQRDFSVIAEAIEYFRALWF